MADKKKTVTVEDREGNKIEVPVGVDGKNPVSAVNPSPKQFVSDEAREEHLAYLKDLAAADKVSDTVAADKSSKS